MLGDINISEPGALMDSAGPRGKRHNGKDLPEGFQTAEFLFRAWFLRLYHEN
jgi:acetyl-CoA carboxylase beta subunit